MLRRWYGVGSGGGVMSTSCSCYVDATSIGEVGWGGGLYQHHVHVTLMLRRDIQRSALLKQVSKTRKTAFYADGAKAWKTAANFLNIKCFQVSHQLRQYCRDINDANIGRMPAKAGTQCIDSDWKNLKVWLPNQSKRKVKLAGTSKVNPRLVLRCYQWCWRRSTGNPKPNQFLNELAKLSGKSNK